MAEGGSRGRVVGNYVLEKQIGSGSFSVVWRARHIHRRGYEVAIKEIVTHKLSQKLRDSLFSETNILRDIKHPNIIRLHDIVEDSGRTFIVLEYCTGGDLAAYIQRCGRFSEAVARHIMIQLAAGLKVLRENNLIHRDLKPQNLLLSTNDANAVLKIADFGFARSLQPQGLAETLCGSPLYMAPEIMQSRKYDAKADLWSVGTILFQLVTGNPPFSGNSQIQLMENIMSSNKLQFPRDVVGDLHPDCIDLCQKLLRRNPVERLSFEEFFNHRFMIQTRPTGVYGNTSMGSGDSTVVETADASQDDCLPLTLDKEPEIYSSSLSPTNNTSSISYSSSHLDTNTLAKRNISNKNFNLPGGKETPSDNIDSDTSMQFSTSKYKHQRSFESAPQKALTFEDEHAANVEQQLVETTSPKVVDSLECIEQEYVLVNAHAASTETSCSSLGASGLDYSQSKAVVSPSKKIQRSTCAPMQIVGAAVGSTCGVESLESQSSIPLGTSEVLGISRDVLDRPSDHPPTRLETLQRCAHLITELAKEKCEAGQKLETFSIQLVCLAIWKKALRVSHTWAASFTESSPCEGLVHSRDMHDEGDFQMAAAACSQLEQEFLRAVESAEQLANCLGPLDGDAEMPDAMEILFQTALALGRKGAMNELFEAKDNAAALYLKSVTLLSFILVEASSLELNPPFSLSTSDRHRLRQYIDCLAHQNQCIAHSRVFVQSEDQQSL